MPVSPTGDDSVYSEEVSGAQHSPKIPGILESLKDEPQLLRVVARARLCGLIARPGSQGAHLHADALMHLVAAQGVQFLPPGPQDRDAPGLGHPKQLGPLPLQPSFTRLEQKPGHAPAVGPQGQEARGQAEQTFQPLGRRQVIEKQAAQLLPARPRHWGEMTDDPATEAPDRPEQSHSSSCARDSTNRRLQRTRWPPTPRSPRVGQTVPESSLKD